MPNEQFIETLDGGSIICQRSAEGNATLSVFSKDGSRIALVDLNNRNLKNFIARIRKVLATNISDVEKPYELGESSTNSSEMKTSLTTTILSPLSTSTPEQTTGKQLA